MKILFDTSVIVEIDRHNSKIISLLKKIVEKEHVLVISTITVAEILTGSMLRKDAKQASLVAKEVLNQFIWQDIDSYVAEITAKMFSQLIIEKKDDQIEYQDVLIAASSVRSHCDVIITFNKKDFCLIESVQKHVYTPDEFEKKM